MNDFEETIEPTFEGAQSSEIKEVKDWRRSFEYRSVLFVCFCNWIWAKFRDLCIFRDFYTFRFFCRFWIFHVLELWQNLNKLNDDIVDNLNDGNGGVEEVNVGLKDGNVGMDSTNVGVESINVRVKDVNIGVNDEYSSDDNEDDNY